MQGVKQEKREPGLRACFAILALHRPVTLQPQPADQDRGERNPSWGIGAGTVFAVSRDTTPYLSVGKKERVFWQGRFVSNCRQRQDRQTTGGVPVNKTERGGRFAYVVSYMTERQGESQGGISWSDLRGPFPSASTRHDRAGGEAGEGGD